MVESVSDGRSVAEHFGRAAPDYNVHALIQKRIATDLAARLSSQGTAKTGLEIGCGTGLLSEHLLARFRETHWIFSDVALPMLIQSQRKLGAKHHFVCCDAEYFQSQIQFDLICSSLCFQWFRTPVRTLKLLHQQLRPGGSMIYSTLGPRTFYQWHDVLNSLNLPTSTLDFRSSEEICAEAGLTAQIENVLYEWKVKSAREFLLGLRAIGASVPKEGAISLHASDLRRAMQEFDRRHSHVCYDVQFVRIDK